MRNFENKILDLSRKILRTSVLFLVCLSVFSCSDDIISSPLGNTSSSASMNSHGLDSPESLIASHGGVKSVQLYWNSSDKVLLYKIYSADSPYSDFHQVGECSGDTNYFNINELSGVSKYYMIKSVDFNRRESSFSNMAFGSTLATPIITSIEKGNDGSSATVKWWMENCSESTYLENVRYEILAYSSADMKNLVSSATSSGADTSVELKNLQSSTRYFFKVEAYLDSNQTTVEESDAVDEETARKLVPNSVENLNVSKGISESEVKVTFSLPELCDVSVGNGTYERHPLYFKISRKEKESDDNTYILLETVRTWSGDYSTYIPGDEVSYIDNTAERGKQYTYKVQSYVDDVKKIISSDKSIAFAEGWKINIPSIKAISTMELEEDGDTVSSITVSFDVSFNDFGETDKYSYVVCQSYIPLDESAEPIEIEKFRADSLEDINSRKVIFESDSEKGYYKYAIYVVNRGSSETPSAENSYTYISSVNSVTVVEKKSDLPQIENFKVADGYSNKFVVSWKYDEHCSYELGWVPYDAENQPSEKKTLTLEKETNKNFVESPESKGFFKVVDGNAIFEHNAVSGDVRQYSLKARTSIDAESVYEERSLTLGTAVIKIKEIAYDKIYVSWNKVQKAKDDDFSISLKYMGDEAELVNEDNVKIENDIEGVYSCIIDKPRGYDDFSKSGKDMILSVTAKSDTVESETSNSKVNVRTLGPALVNCKVDGIYSDKISVKWNKIEGAKGYLIYRARYGYSDSQWKIESSDKYFYDFEKGELSVIGGDLNGDSANVVLNGETFNLTDKYVDSTENYTYQVNQSKISWGIPFGYVVLPVLKQGDFEFDENSFKLAEGSHVRYNSGNSLTDVKGATYGYGLNIKAQKAMSGKTQIIEWDAPYHAEKNPTLYRKRINSNDWTEVKSANFSDGNKKATYIPENEDAYLAFEYIVKYDSSKSFAKSYLSYCENLKASDSPTELANKGYLLAVDFSAKYNGTPTTDGISYENDGNYYSEKVDWDAWGTERALKPTSCKIYVKNLNHAESKGGNWTLLATLDNNCILSSTPESFFDTTIENAETNLILKPTGISNGTSQVTNGILQVLRDAKHHYKLELKRNEVTVDIEKYAYRQITGEELAKSVSLIIADAIYQAGIGDGDNRSCEGELNRFNIKHNSSSKTIIWGTDGSDYIHIFRAGLPGKIGTVFNSEFIVNLPRTESRSAADGHILYHLPEGTIKVSNKNGLNSYSGNVTIRIGETGRKGWTELSDGVTKSFVLKMTKDGNTIKEITQSNENEFYNWFPYDIGIAHNSADATLNTNLKTYQSPWWED